MPGVFLSEKEDFVSFEYCDDFDLKTQLFKPKDITHNGLRAGARNPVLRLRQGYGACTLLSDVFYLFWVLSTIF
jgi:hypothetical protein